MKDARFNVLEPAHTRLHRYLEDRGITLAPIRQVLIWQTAASTLCLLTGLLMWTQSSWGLWTGAGMLLGAWNFYGLAKFIIHLIPTGWNSKLLWGQILRLHGRLLFTAVFVYAALVWCSAPPFAVLAGLAAAMLPVVFIGFLSKKRKP